MGTLFYVLKMCIRFVSWHPADSSPCVSAGSCFLYFRERLQQASKNEEFDEKDGPALRHAIRNGKFDDEDELAVRHANENGKFDDKDELALQHASKNGEFDDKDGPALWHANKNGKFDDKDEPALRHANKNGKFDYEDELTLRHANNITVPRTLLYRTYCIVAAKSPGSRCRQRGCLSQFSAPPPVSNLSMNSINFKK